MSQKYKLQRGEFERHFENNLRFLRKSAESFDNGDTDEATRIAILLATILHTKGRQVSLIDHLGIKPKFHDSTFKPNDLHDDSIVFPPAPLTIGAIGFPKPCYPILDYFENTATWEHFEIWWNAIVLTDIEGNKLSRKEIVLSIRDKEGAHIDAELGEEFAAMQKRNSIQQRYLTGNEEWVEITNIPYITVRQIGHEVLRSFFPTYRKYIGKSVNGNGILIPGHFSLLSGETVLHDEL
jgi:hypothetical protein